MKCLIHCVVYRCRCEISYFTAVTSKWMKVATSSSTTNRRSVRLPSLSTRSCTFCCRNSSTFSEESCCCQVNIVKLPAVIDDGSDAVPSSSLASRRISRIPILLPGPMRGQVPPLSRSDVIISALSTNHQRGTDQDPAVPLSGLAARCQQQGTAPGIVT